MRRLVYLPFQASAQGLLCDGVSVQSIVDRVGTPAYVYSAQAIRHAYQAIDTAFADSGYRMQALLVEVVANPAFRVVGDPQ